MLWCSSVPNALRSFSCATNTASTICFFHSQSFLFSCMRFTFSVFFTLQFFSLHISTPYLTNNPPPFFTHSTSLPIPPHFSFHLRLCRKPMTIVISPYSINFPSPRHDLWFPSYTNFLFSLLLILTGDVNLSPGSHIITPAPLNSSLLNNRSASSITDQLKKPSV